MKIYTYLSILIFAGLCLIPPVDVVIQNPQHPYWLWMILIAGFLGFYTLFIKTDWPVKFIAVAGFIHCFFSVSPYMSFTSYVTLVACCYFYICACKIEDWNVIYNALKAIVFLQIVLMVMQFLNKDVLLNFGLFHVEHYGTIGHRMQMGSLAVILSCLLIPFNKYFILFPIGTAIFCNSTWTFICAGIAVAVYFYEKSHVLFVIVLISFGILFAGWAIRDHKIMENMDSNSGRVAIWKKSFELANQRPLTGWGIGTFKNVFFPLSKLTCFQWRTAHNFIAEMVFEVGYPLTICLLFTLGSLAMTLFLKDQWLLLASLSMMFCDALIHFPDRSMNCLPLMIVFFALTKFTMRRFA